MELDPRKQALLEAIVDTYVERAEPVASEWLAVSRDLGVRSATIRNELAEMTELGYLRQPHTSAGRVPSTLGYRYYVDHLMPPARLDSGAARRLRGIQKVSEGDVEQLLVQTCRVLSSLTGYTSMAAPPTGDEPRVRSAHLVQMDARRVLLVVVLDSGRVVHRFLEPPRPLSPADVSRISAGLEEWLRGRGVSSVTGPPALPPELMPHEALIGQLLRTLGQALAEPTQETFLEGTSHMLGQPEFRDPDRVEPLIRLLEERRTVYQELRRLAADERVAVVIGEENPHHSLRECSVVLAHYRVGGRLRGWVGVIGPTRMRYGTAVPAVDYAARCLSEVFTRIGLA